MKRSPYSVYIIKDGVALNLSNIEGYFILNIQFPRESAVNIYKNTVHPVEF